MRVNCHKYNSRTDNCWPANIGPPSRRPNEADDDVSCDDDDLMMWHMARYPAYQHPSPCTAAAAASECYTDAGDYEMEVAMEVGAGIRQCMRRTSPWIKVS